jgi:predicted nucleic acid-binding protein
VNLFYDTSILVASSSASHIHHTQAIFALRLLRNDRNHGWISQHAIAETYSILTSAPLVPRIHPSEAVTILEENILPYVQVVSLERADYQKVIREMAAGLWRSGKIYDALHLCCAEKQPIDRIYTFDVSDFRRLAPHLHAKIRAPELPGPMPA